MLVTGFDIIFFWVARMMMQGIHFMGDVPFRTVYIHGLVRDERGQKMSKSKGNIIDPLELIDRYGADALRFTICALTGPGRDVKLGAARVESYRRFVTKLWNAARFCEMNDIAPDASFDPVARHAAADALDPGRAEPCDRGGHRGAGGVSLRRVRRRLLPLHLGHVLRLVRRVRQAGAGARPRCVQTAAYVLGTILRLLHPAMPFVTEELWDRFGYGEPCSLIRTPWPEPVGVTDAAAARVELDWVVRLISEVRSVRTEMNVPPGTLTPILLRDAAPETLARGQRWMEAIRRLARASELSALVGEMPKGAAQLVLDEATVVLPLADAIDIGTERARLTRERDKATGEARKIAQKLDNADFVRRAPEEVVEENRDRLAADAGRHRASGGGVAADRVAVPPCLARSEATQASSRQLCTEQGAIRVALSIVPSLRGIASSVSHASQ